MEDFTLQIKDLAIAWGWKLLAAVIILIIGFWVSKVVRSMVLRVMRRREVEPVIVTFTGHLIYIALMTFVIIAAISKLGVQTTSFVAILGAAGLAVGLALKGSLSNFAAGFLLIMFRPIRAGDYIEGGGTAGVVDKIQVFTTILKTPDNRTVVIPNSKLLDDNIVNYSLEETRRVDLQVGVGYGDDLQHVKQVLRAIVNADERIMKDPESVIAVKELADSSVNFVVRVWVKSADYWNVHFDTTEQIKIRFDEERISIPYPQTDVHLFENKE